MVWMEASGASEVSIIIIISDYEGKPYSIVAHFEAIWKKAQYTDKHILSSSQPPSPSTKGKHKQLLSLYAWS